MSHSYLMVKVDTGSYCRASLEGPWNVSKVNFLYHKLASESQRECCLLQGMAGIALLLDFAFGRQTHLAYSWQDMLHSFNHLSAFCLCQEQLRGARTSSTTTPQPPSPRTSPTTSPRQSGRMSGTPCVSVAAFLTLFCAGGRCCLINESRALSDSPLRALISHTVCLCSRHIDLFLGPTSLFLLLTGNSAEA